MKERPRVGGAAGWGGGEGRGGEPPRVGSDLERGCARNCTTTTTTATTTGTLGGRDLTALACSTSGTFQNPPTRSGPGKALGREL